MLQPIISEKKIQTVKALLEESERIVITCHMAPDGDALGASLGLLHTLANVGKEARIMTPDRIPESLRFLPGAKDIVPYSMYTDFASKLLSDANLIFCLDYNALYRIDRMAEPLSAATAKKILIDHHESPQDFVDVCISHPDQSSTSMLVFRLICRLGLHNKIDRKAASCIYTGMMTDTGNFSYNSNDPDIYTIIAELVRKGVNKDEIYKRVMDTKKANVLRLNGYAVSNMELFANNRAALITLSADELKRFDYQKGDTEGLVNQPLSIEGVIYSVFLREDEHFIKVSTRSKGTFPVNRICERYFNGGGHVNASGGELECSLAEAVDIFKQSLNDLEQFLSQE